ncbi:hypothetical protein ABII15_12340 [Streptomyces sp. HUAS MG91]|uniref:Uncharacterized protein n=1 Tax=Streptomyces tabacisoli TaxID=3156398 RepID=A0AAU8IRN2_9ACTN
MDLPDSLTDLQRAADEEGRKIEHLDDGERERQRSVWFDAAARVQEAVTRYAEENGLDPHDVEKRLRQAARHLPQSEE